MALILRAEAVFPFSALSDVFDEARGEFELLTSSKSLMITDALHALVAALTEIRKEAPAFQFHFKTIFIPPANVVENYHLQPRGTYSPNLDESYSWLGSAFTIATESYLFTRYGTTVEAAVNALLGAGFIREYNKNDQMHFRLDKPRNYLYHRCYLA